MDKLLWQVQNFGTKTSISIATATISVVGTKTVQALQNKYGQSLSMVGQGTEAIPQPVLSMEIRICIIDL